MSCNHFNSGPLDGRESEEKKRERGGGGVDQWEEEGRSSSTEKYENRRGYRYFDYY